jgi:hypothetical protein
MGFAAAQPILLVEAFILRGSLRSRLRMTAPLQPQPRLLEQRHHLVAEAGHAFDPARPGEQNAVEAGFL